MTHCSSEPRCRCTTLGANRYGADCSSLGLNTFPTFSLNVTEIIMYNNDLGCITAAAPLPSGLQKLDLRDCQLQYIEKGFLHQFTRLEYLDISFNREITLEVLTNFTYDLQFTAIKVLKFNAVQCKFGKDMILKRHHLHHLRNTNLTEIQLSSNRLSSLEQFVILNLPHTIERVIATNNRFKLDLYALEISTMPNIKYVDLSSMYKSSERYLTGRLFDCTDTKQSTFFYDLENKHVDRHMSSHMGHHMDTQHSVDFKRTTSIRYDLRADNHVNDHMDSHMYNRHMTSQHSVDFKRATSSKFESCISDTMQQRMLRLEEGTKTLYVCMPPSLKTLILSHCSLGGADELDMTYLDLRNVERFVMNDNFRTSLEGEMFGNKTTFLDYSSNFISYIHPLFFKDANLTHLNLSNNYLGNQLATNESSQLLQDQTWLVNLSLSNNNIFRIPRGFFDRWQQLELLDLSDNQLEEVAFDLKKLRNLKEFSLSNNRLKTLSLQTMQELDSIPGPLSVDLSQNELICSCDSVHFLKWMDPSFQESTISFTNITNYWCTFPNSSVGSFANLTEIIYRLEKECASYIGVIVASVIAVSTILVTITGGIVYRYRWRIRYIYYMAKRSYRGNVRIQHGDYRNMFRFDAFISYSSDDRQFAVHEIRKQIEDQTDLRLCFHERDFLPGYDIAENIANAIHDSRKVVCIMSNNFLRSEWCMYEFNMALMERVHARDGDDMLVLVLMKEFDTNRASLPILQFIRDKSYAEFPDDESCRPMFWSRMIETITLD